MKTYRYYYHAGYSHLEMGDLLYTVEANNLGEADRKFTKATTIELPDQTISTWEKQ
jgi:hypothetical protein